MSIIFEDLGLPDELQQLRQESKECGVEFIQDPISYDDFFRRFLLPNKPCLLGGNGIGNVIQHWQSINEWVQPNGTPDFDFLERQFGGATVPVANCGKVQYYAQPKQDMKFSEYLRYWRGHIATDYQSSQGCLYLKDWHFTRAFSDYEAYSTPIYFSSDWLNEYWDHLCNSGDDYRFVYMGPKHSCWSANICGRKRWLLLPPGEESYLRDNLGNLVYDLNSSELHDGKKYPHSHQAREPLEVIQEAGQVIFVPSGWHHQVFNLEDTISINHNWLNGCNIDITWRFLQDEFKAVQKSIEDCRDMDGWEEQCQLIMKASTGMDYPEFFNFLHLVASNRLSMLSKLSHELKAKHNAEEGSCRLHSKTDINAQGHSCAKSSEMEDGPEHSDTARGVQQCLEDNAPTTSTAASSLISAGGDEVGRWRKKYLIYDLWRVQQTLEDLIRNKDFADIDTSRCAQEPTSLLQEILAHLKEWQIGNDT
ncbi:2-oxoglutarate and iron-dependent oxygenase JMJD4-like isoform X2 [Diadema setosum]|uniref:2-oxoglutarate and iron-dependent oxygenase JMJD4-like isoform X2 n=1 Tax=Diadema setosum TaxID=31175 RepID=UPI003B3A2277